MFTDLVNLIFPNLCVGCEDVLVKGEKAICVSCLHKAPKTDFIEAEGNVLEKLFWGKSVIKAGMALYYFQKQGIVQRMFHSLKYEGRKEVGEYLGQLIGDQLQHSDRFKEIDEVIPVPLHPRKERERGYNQSEWVARGIRAALGLRNSEKNLIRLSYTDSQTKKSRAERWKNVETAFAVTNEETLMGKNILLVDDVVTTGSTLISCANKLKKVENTNLYIATVAIATD